MGSNASDEPRILVPAMVEVPQTLYHYTSMEGLLGIVQKRQIWASHIRYLNDRMEQDHIWSVVENRARERLKQTDDPAIKSALETLPADVARRTRTHAYVASFSADGDLLSQWLSYCPDGKGFAIGFGTRSLSTNNLAQHKKMIEMHAAGVAPDPARLAALYSVSYYSGTSAHSQYDPLFLDALIDVYGGIQPLPAPLPTFDNLDEPLRTYLRLWSTPQNVALLRLRLLESVVKDASFSQERECRLLLQGQPREIFFRPGKSMLIPYIKYDLDKGEGYFVEKVIVGPCPDPDLSVQSVKMLFQSEGQPSVEVIKSTIPYRSW